MRFPGIIFFFLFIIFSCKKDNTTVQCYVHDLSLNKPFANGRVNLIERKSTLSFESSDTKILATAISDENGNCNFSIRTKFLPKYSYYLSFDYDEKKYITSEVVGGTQYGKATIVDEVDIDKKETNNVSFYIAPLAEISITGNNINPFDSNDDIKVYAKNDYEERIIFSYTGSGQGANTGYHTLLAGKEILTWIVTRNNIATTFYGDTLSLIHNEKRDYTINY